MAAETCLRQSAYDSGKAAPGMVSLVDCRCSQCATIHKQSAPYVDEPYRNRCVGCGEEWPCIPVRAGDGFARLLAALKGLVEANWLAYDSDSERALTYEEADEILKEFPLTDAVDWRCTACGGGGRSLDATQHGLVNPDGELLPCPVIVATALIAELMPRK